MHPPTTPRAGLWLGFLVALVMVAALGYVFRERLGLSAPAPARDSLRLAAYDGDVGALEWIALDKGFFTQAGLDVEVRGFDAGRAAVRAMEAGEVDVATAADLVVAIRSFDNPDLRILADICRYWNKGLIGRRDHAIATAGDLRGKRVGVTKTSSAEHALVVFLALHGLTIADVEVVNLPPAEIVDQMASGAIDAAITWQPHVQDIERRLGANAVTLWERGTEAHLLVLTRTDALPGKSEAIKKLLRGLILAREWMRDHPGEAKAYLATRFKLEPEYVATLWPRLQFTVSLPQEILEAMDGSALWFAHNNNREDIPNYINSIRQKELSSISPASVTIITR